MLGRIYLGNFTEEIEEYIRNNIDKLYLDFSKHKDINNHFVLNLSVKFNYQIHHDIEIYITRYNEPIIATSSKRRYNSLARVRKGKQSIPFILSERQSGRLFTLLQLEARRSAKRLRGNKLPLWRRVINAFLYS